MDIRSAIQKLSKQDIYESVLGKIKEVDTSVKTCTVTPLEDAPDILEVRLSAVQSPPNGIIAIPTIGSWVIVGQTATDQPHIVMFSELDSYSILFGNTEYKLTEEGLQLSVGSNDLKEGLDALKTALLNLTVMTPQGQSSIPINQTDINNAFSKILGTLQ